MTAIDIDIQQSSEQSRAKRLKAATAIAHERLDAAIMAGRPFESRARYARFLAVQRGFHRDIDALYADPGLNRLLPGLAGRRRLALIAQDLADLGADVPSSAQSPVFAPDANIDVPTALGWLYVAEGSNLGAAFLLKQAAALDLTETFGARHLAPAPEGRGLHWKRFVAALDAVALDPSGEAAAVAGATAAFDSVRARVDAAFA